MTLLNNLVFLLLFSLNIQAESLEDFAREAQVRCNLPASDEAIVYQEDFRWNMSREEILEKAEEIYDSGKRLKGRAYYDMDVNEFILPLNRAGDFDVKMPVAFAYSVKRHIEESLKLEYVEAIVFPDMGHAHFFIPQETYDAELASINGLNQHLRYEKMLGLKGLKVLYHTAEQLQMQTADKKLLEDDGIRWRYYTRNLVGDNQGKGRLEIFKNLGQGFNTVKQAEGYKYWGAGFDLSASRDGCFSYTHKGKKFYFDISLESLPLKGY